MKTYDKSLTEVWEWKDKVSEETKGLSAEDFVKKLRKNADSLLSRHHVELASTSLPDKRKKVA